MSSFTKIRDAFESVADLGGNYLLPGSSLLTNHLVSKGSQKQLNSTIGKIAQFASGAAGGGLGSDFTGIPSASSIGAGWTGLGNAAGSVVGYPTAGTDVSNSLSSFLNGSGASSAASKADANSFAPLDGANTGVNQATDNLVNSFSGQQGSNVLSPPSTLGVGTAPGASSYGGSGALGVGGSSYGNLATLVGGANSLLANDTAQKDLLDAQKRAENVILPYSATGASANSRLSDLLGTSSNTGAEGYGSLTKPFTPGDLTQDPGYKFQLDQGNQALQRQAAATGRLDSGASLKAAQQFGQGLADSTYNNAFNRNLQQNQQIGGALSGASGAGQNAATSLGTIYGNTGTAKANAGISSSNILNSTLSSLLNGSGAKKPVNIGGQVVYI